MSQLWFQQKVQSGAITLNKIKNIYNSSDGFTNHFDFSSQRQCLEQLDMWHADGRSEMAPELNHADETPTLMPLLLEKLAIKCYHI